MTLKQICEITNNQLIINLPESFKNKKKVMVTVDDALGNNSEKLALLKFAANDPLFIADIKAVNDDFENIDHETL